MLPRATHTRATRDATRGRLSGRSAEIQRLIGRSLRAVVDLKAMPGFTVTVDCDVLQADGGTRTASVTAGYVALVQALAQPAPRRRPRALAGPTDVWPRSRWASSAVCRVSISTTPRTAAAPRST